MLRGCVAPLALTAGVTVPSTQAMRSMLVEPGVPNGTPAVMTTRCPPRDLLALRHTDRLLHHLGEVLDVGEVYAMRAPDSARRRAVSIFGVSARIGAVGRSRAARSAVAPELVKETIAAAPIVSGDLAAAALIASAIGVLGRQAAGVEQREIEQVLCTRRAMRSIIATASIGYFADGGLCRQHHRVGALIDGGRDIGGLGAGWGRRADHQFQHLRGDDHRLAGDAAAWTSASARSARPRAASRPRDRRAPPSGRRQDR